MTSCRALSNFGDYFGVKKEPDFVVGQNRAYNWRRPTLTGPIAPLPSALRSFTAGFGMGPGGSSSLWLPEVALCATF